MGIKDTILKYTLLNAAQYGGKANPGSVIGRVIAEHPEAKADMKSLAKDVAQVIADVAKMPQEEQLQKLKEVAPELLEKKQEKEKDIFEFLGISQGEKVVTCFPPEPSKYPHIGHAKALLLNYELAKRNKGTFILRFEDTNPLLAETHLYEVHRECYAWLGVEPDKIENASSYMDDFYRHAETLINKGGAYLCTCSQESIKEGRFKSIDCPCRSNGIEENQKRWKELFQSKEEGMILRLRGDMQSNNTVMRDPTLMRVIDSPHCITGTKYRVWPTYDFENSVMDGIQGTTHRLRTKEFELRNEAQRYIQRLLGFRETKISEFGRFNMEGIESSGRIIREKVKSGELIGWDDPSLTTLVALKRRGILPMAIKDFVLSTGITKNETVMTWDDLYAHNRKLLDAKANRYFFIDSPRKITISGAPKQQVHLKKHPEDKSRGMRVLETHEEFLLTERDFLALENSSLYRLMDCVNFTFNAGAGTFHSTEYDIYKEQGKRIMHFLPNDKQNVQVEVLMPDRNVVRGVAEPSIREVQKDEVVQFERFGFVKLDAIEDGIMKFWYTHK